MRSITFVFSSVLYDFFLPLLLCVLFFSMLPLISICFDVEWYDRVWRFFLFSLMLVWYILTLLNVWVIYLRWEIHKMEKLKIRTLFGLRKKPKHCWACWSMALIRTGRSGSFNKLTVEQRILPELNKICRSTKTFFHYKNKMKTLRKKHKEFCRSSPFQFSQIPHQNPW